MTTYVHCTSGAIKCHPSMLLRVVAVFINLQIVNTWICPQVTLQSSFSCTCDMPHTLRCSGVQTPGSDSIQVVTDVLRGLPEDGAVSLLDLSIQNVTSLPGFHFRNVSLHGLVMSSGELVHVSENAFTGLEARLTALGLSNNKLTSIPSEAFTLLSNLEQLDLSKNQITAIPSHVLQGLFRLHMLDLSDNSIRRLAVEAFVYVPNLKSLHLQGNQIDVSNLDNKALRGLRNITELNLSRNLLKGSLTSTSIGRLPSLQTLDLSYNNLTSIRRGCLESLKSLRSLDVSSNLIDVIEDHAFLHLTKLSHLDLSHNQIVAVSGYSLAHLDGLRTLSVGHNYLRTVTGDLLSGLRNLEQVALQDNDVTAIQPGVFRGLTNLGALNMEDNPLNCDCKMQDFHSWLKNNSQLPEEDRKSAVCAIPPALENGILAEMNQTELTCSTDKNEFDELADQATDSVVVSSAMFQLQSFDYNGVDMELLWTVDTAALPYKCDALFIYEELHLHEVLLDSIPLQCDSRLKHDPGVVLVSLKGIQLQQGHVYRYCLVLIEEGTSDDMSLLPGCSDAMPLFPTRKPGMEAVTPSVIMPLDSEEVDVYKTPKPKLTAFYANITAPNTVSVYMRVPDATKDCVFTAVVFLENSVVAVQRLNCSSYTYTFRNVPSTESHYQVCATYVRSAAHEDLPLPVYTVPDSQRVPGAKDPSGYSHCVRVKKGPTKSAGHVIVTVVVAVVFVIVSTGLLGLIYIIAKRIFPFSKTPALIMEPRRKSLRCYFLYTPEPRDNSGTVSLEDITEGINETTKV